MANEAEMGPDEWHALARAIACARRLAKRKAASRCDEADLAILRGLDDAWAIVEAVERRMFAARGLPSINPPAERY